ncbi:ATP-dependent helicase HrpB [Nakamurella sp. A5-74]|uniref:ATP-dependent helicase HrpB n=1 Tax=Nakamurella sp. A5-74 TaxID=3158264 RepID=A0AAU8DNI4_9ACTN
MTSPPLLPGPEAPGADLPVRPALAELVEAVRARGTAVLVAPPGSGKTSLLPLALADAVDGRVIVAEPRRLATRAAAHRLAWLIGERPGDRIGYAMRDERAGSARTRVEVVTTGLLVQRLQRDPELAGVGAIVIDECHERHLDADLALAFCVDVRDTLRPDLALIATSATPDTEAMTRALGGADTPVVTAATASFPVTVEWVPPPQALPLLADARVDPRLLVHVAAVVLRALQEGPGDVLVFVPGEAEIAGVIRNLGGGIHALPLYGRQTRVEQERALTPSDRQQVVVTTAVAESSLTVPGIRAVVDAGLARQPRTDPSRGLSALVTTRVSRAAADQRAGRAGREGPGRVYRCWSAVDHSHLADHTPPEIATADLAGFALSMAAWGAPGGRGLALLSAPPVAALDVAVDLLRELGAVDADGRITQRGQQIAGISAHPRLARALLDGAPLVGTDRAREVVALLSDDSLTGRSDDLPARWREMRQGVDRAASARWRDEIRRLGRSGEAGRSPESAGVTSSRTPDDLAAGMVVGLAYPDRIARARSTEGVTYQLLSGTGAALVVTSGLRRSTWLAVASADRPVGRADARIRSAAPIDEATARLVAGDLVTHTDDIRWHDGRVVAERVESLGAIRLAASPIGTPDPALLVAAITDGLRRSGLEILPWSEAAIRLRERMSFCHTMIGAPWPAVDDTALLADLDGWLGPDLQKVRRSKDLGRVDILGALRRLLPWPAAARLDELAPDRLRVPSGNQVRVGYDGDSPPVVAVKLQEMFGWTVTPRLADGRAPIVLHLLSPAGRTVAITGDLASFWVQGYPQARAELRARYPRHPWPEDPLTAEPTRRVKPRS